MLCINTFGRVRYFPDQAKKKFQNGRTSTLNNINSSAYRHDTSGTLRTDQLKIKSTGDVKTNTFSTH